MEAVPTVTCPAVQPANQNRLVVRRPIRAPVEEEAVAVEAEAEEVATARRKERPEQVEEAVAEEEVKGQSEDVEEP